MKPIRITKHAQEQFNYRGTTEEEIIETIQTSNWAPAELGRLEARKDFSFNSTWNKKFYKIKQVRPIFIEEESEIVVVTVYVYYV
ncbi:MAG: hypothetical protein COZ37_01760 [bacterium (Candidatus Ratteibacteria) CG_4_10_14_3_um_filter_41_18]|uniref:DUF4258 domain-containing protein n=4 Tax=Candidatus Ratteibacteria TaxID=2979319 RepID=A0A2M7YFD5_9BACT|nr:MAG: hypothetical protein AUJ76_02385 [Candidatus Omnitrophica bacterium CG1_02_41_171]PIW33912.1 MAG: hypothetical protein COW28_02085 [bacterium (Candidatus Ratteibacteria) CG15_BIG_FIL_POST_REV_8_21_14_020_41_12]PIW74212.1 MAG: hypothetical protein CO004_01870 [bacterium (Candidatus Ratteibacteria) CG_4_8_14_3_um_filter_41_36]PIX77615.1 MAG: hypothetical protein COZ37_01760 [bacterium (Candidatus Ratteibacteria) CG_4_10_14_3_um_filter_41_18]PJA61676.1 MAG: hypothetical protein CO162_05040